jgi:uncharacterized protein with PQ loop repeat
MRAFVNAIEFLVFKSLCYYSSMPYHSAHHLVNLSILNKKREKRIVSRFVMILSVIGPITTIPQIYKVWFGGDANGVSETTWLFYVINSVIWLVYGLQIKNKPIIISSSLWVLMDTAVALGVIIYG